MCGHVMLRRCASVLLQLAPCVERVSSVRAFASAGQSARAASLVPRSHALQDWQAKLQSLPPGMRQQMSRVMSDPAEMENMMKHLGIDFQRFGERRTGQELIKQHQTSVKFSMGRHRGRTMVHMDPPTLFVDKKATASTSRSSPEYEACTPIAVSALQLGITHRGRVLRGKLVHGVAPLTGINVMLQDSAGATPYIRG